MPCSPCASSRPATPVLDPNTAVSATTTTVQLHQAKVHCQTYNRLMDAANLYETSAGVVSHIVLRYGAWTNAAHGSTTLDASRRCIRETAQPVAARNNETRFPVASLGRSLRGHTATPIVTWTRPQASLMRPPTAGSRVRPRPGLSTCGPRARTVVSPR